jgi:hypothetical protein
MAQRSHRRWDGSRFEELSGCPKVLKLEPVLNEPGDRINAALSKANATLSEADCLLRHASRDALHASHG